LKVECDERLSSFSTKVNLRRYAEVSKALIGSLADVQGYVERDGVLAVGTDE